MNLHWPEVLAFLAAAAIVAISLGHAVLRKADVRAAIGWVGFILVFPVVGSVIYWIFGVNRIRRRARGLGGDRPPPSTAREELRGEVPDSATRPAMPPSGQAQIAYLVGAVVKAPLTGGNRVEKLVNGEEAYPSMLEAIGNARRSVTLETYIFDDDPTGKEFVEVLAAARDRGVEVRVLVDAMGRRYSWPPIGRRLSRHDIPHQSFLPTVLPWKLPFVNLRTHRKILVVDGKVGFLGGMNIRQGHRMESGARELVQDLHFRVEGPLVSHLQLVFAADWLFASSERLQGDVWFPEAEEPGEARCRLIADGPDGDIDRIRWTLLGALTAAQDSVRIATPYFLPDRDLVTALSVAALRGVEVDILLPSENNLPVMQWASIAELPYVMEHGCRVFLTPPPFDHSKVLVVDRAWSLVGSANWDPRSLRLNFELAMETYDEGLAGELEDLVIQRRDAGRQLTRDDLASRGLLLRLRDGFTRLAQPYL